MLRVRVIRDQPPTDTITQLQTFYSEHPNESPFPDNLHLNGRELDLLAVVLGLSNAGPLPIGQSGTYQGHASIGIPESTRQQLSYFYLGHSLEWCRLESGGFTPLDVIQDAMG